MITSLMKELYKTQTCLMRLKYVHNVLLTRIIYITAIVQLLHCSVFLPSFVDHTKLNAIRIIIYTLLLIFTYYKHERVWSKH